MISLLLLRVMSYSACGALLGAAYFSALRWNVRLYASRGGTALKALLVHLLRIISLVAIFALCVRQGAAPLLESFAGFLAARTIALYYNLSAMEGRS